MYVLYYCLTLSTLLLILLLSDCLFSTEYANRQSAMRREQRGRDYVWFAPSLGGRGATGMYSVIFVHCSPLLFFSLFLFSVVSFFAKIINRRAEAGPDRTDADGNRNAGQDEGVNGYAPCYFLFSTLFVSLLILLIFHCLQY